MKANNIKIGMTGGIGSGKNKAAEIFETLGFYTIDADQISRKVMSRDESAYKKIVETFGKNILNAENEIDRKKLGEIVFSDDDKRNILENIVHPEIFKEENRVRNSIRSKDGKALVITHAPLMVESGSYKNYDILIAVFADNETRIKRVMARNGISEESVKKIMETQLPEEEKISKAHIIINNNASEIELQTEVERVANLIRQIVYGIKHK